MTQINQPRLTKDSQKCNQAPRWILVEATMRSERFQVYRINAFLESTEPQEYQLSYGVGTSVATSLQAKRLDHFSSTRILVTWEESECPSKPEDIIEKGSMISFEMMR